MLNLELIKDGLKLVVIFLPLVYFLIKSKDVIINHRRFLLLIGGFLTMLLGGILDFTDEFAMLDNILIVGANFPHHEAAEDFLGIVGFIFFALGVMIEIHYVKKENVEKKKMIQKLQEQTKQLERFDKLKSKFVEDVSHEFRSPMTSISLTISNIIDGLMGGVSEQQKSALNLGRRNLERLSRLATDTLTLSQIKSGKMAMDRKLSNISSLAEEAYLSLKPMFDNKNIAFKKICRLKDPIAWCDGNRILQVFINLLSNGLKYSPPKTQITVKISVEDENIRVEIADQGKGMSQEDADKLFSRFERLGIKDKDGIGLGLSITKEIIAMHQGRIWVESKLQEGTRFSFSIPKDLRTENR